MSTLSPGRSAARVTSMRHAVRPTSGNAAAFSGVRFFGAGKTFARGTAIFSANVPETCSPRMRKSTQRLVSPARQNSHVPSERPGWITTGSPGERPDTPAPTASTVPYPSAPGTCGNAIGTAGDPVPHEEVEPVHRRRLQLDDDLAQPSAPGRAAHRARGRRCRRAIRGKQPSSSVSRSKPTAMRHNPRLTLPHAAERSPMRAWEIRQKKAQKRARELARKERQKTKRNRTRFVSSSSDASQKRQSWRPSS